MNWLNENWFKIGLLIVLFVIGIGLFQRYENNKFVKDSSQSASQFQQSINNDVKEQNLISELASSTPATSTPEVLGESTVAPVSTAKPQPTKSVDNSETIKKAEQEAGAAKKAQQEAEAKAATLETQQKQQQQVEAQKVYCENLLNKKNAELFKYKEGYSSQLNQISQGMQQAKANYQVRLENAYGNQALWDLILQEMDENATKWQVLLNSVNAYWDAKKSEIDALPLCPNY